jgi:signal transduction histidine kinase
LPTRDLVLAVAATTLAEVELWLAAERIDGPLDPHVLVNLLILPALAIRTVAPLGAALLGALSLALQPLAGSAPLAVGFLVLLVVLVSLGWHADTRRGLIGVAAVVVSGLFFELTDDGVLLADLVVNVVIIVATWAAGRGLRVAVDRRVEAEVQAEGAARVAAQEERGRISRDLHDSLAHALTLMTLQAGSARERATEAGSADALRSIELTGRAALADLHGFLQLLSSSPVDPPGVQHVGDLVAGVRRNGLEVHLEIAAGILPTGVSTTVYRVVQEGLTNVVRHSDATTAAVAVRREERGVVTVVSSVGRPRSTRSPGGGRGLVGLRERLAVVGGSLHSEATVDGWRLEARIPLAGDGA